MSLVGWDWKHACEREWTEPADKEREMRPGVIGAGSCGALGLR